MPHRGRLHRAGRFEPMPYARRTQALARIFPMPEGEAQIWRIQPWWVRTISLQAEEIWVLLRNPNRYPRRNSARYSRSRSVLDALQAMGGIARRHDLAMKLLDYTQDSLDDPRSFLKWRKSRLMEGGWVGVVPVYRDGRWPEGEVCSEILEAANGLLAKTPGVPHFDFGRMIKRPYSELPRISHRRKPQYDRRPGRKYAPKPPRRKRQRGKYGTITNA